MTGVYRVVVGLFGGIRDIGLVNMHDVLSIHTSGRRRRFFDTVRPGIMMIDLLHRQCHLQHFSLTLVAPLGASLQTAPHQRGSSESSSNVPADPCSDWIQSALVEALSGTGSVMAAVHVSIPRAARDPRRMNRAPIVRHVSIPVRIVSMITIVHTTVIISFSHSCDIPSW